MTPAGPERRVSGRVVVAGLAAAVALTAAALLWVMREWVGQLADRLLRWWFS